MLTHLSQSGSRGSEAGPACPAASPGRNQSPFRVRLGVPGSPEALTERGGKAQPGGGCYL